MQYLLLSLSDLEETNAYKYMNNLDEEKSQVLNLHVGEDVFYLTKYNARPQSKSLLFEF